MKARTLLLSLLALFGASGHVAALAQEAADGVEVLEFSWTKERIRPRPSLSSLASPEELVRQSRREGQLAAARNTANRGASSRIETEMTNEEKATAKAARRPPDDGYRYKVKLRNNGVRRSSQSNGLPVHRPAHQKGVPARPQLRQRRTINRQDKRIEVLTDAPVRPQRAMSRKRADDFHERCCSSASLQDGQSGSG